MQGGIDPWKEPSIASLMQTLTKYPVASTCNAMSGNTVG